MNARTTPRLFGAVTTAIAVAAASVFVVRARSAPEDLTVQVDRVFHKWDSQATPGCAVGVAVEGKPALAKAYGMADLERDVKNTPETIFEAGSVSKQFTAAAILLLAREGKLSLDDPARKYVPELRDYGTPLTIRHMLTHTSGLRDWGSVEAIAGWPRTSRVYTHAHVLEIVSRQRALNFTPGTHWSYSNTGYNLAAVIVSRVSGQSFADFTRDRLFQPLGMSHTGWRDDHTRIVRNRAIAYADEQDGFHIEMPFENVHGNGGLLTTVGDLLKWNEHFDSPPPDLQPIVAEQQQAGHFSDGRVHHYAFGLEIGTYHGVRQVDHSGSTAGYRAHLARYPDQHLSVAVLCNVTSGAATQYAREVADLYLGDRAKVTAPTAAHALTPAEIERLAGVYRDVETMAPIRIVSDKEGIRVERGPALVPQSGTEFVTANGEKWTFDRRGARAVDPYGSVESYERVELAHPTPAQLAELTGSYASGEAETTLTVGIADESLVIKRRPDTTTKLTAAYKDVFTAPQFGAVVFRRDAAGHVNGLSVVQDRVWDLRFTREAAGRSVSQWNH